MEETKQISEQRDALRSALRKDEDVTDANDERLPDDDELQRQVEHMREALAQDGSTAHAVRVLADVIEQEGVERVVYGKGHAELVELNRVLVMALREYALIGIGQRIMDSSDAQHFRWLLEHHSGTDGNRCWIGGVDFSGTDVRDAIDTALEAEARIQAGITPTTHEGKCGNTGEAGNGSPA